SQIDTLKDDTKAQLSDGIGEDGFEVFASGSRFILMSNIEKPISVEKVVDGVVVPLPSRIARAARDGDLQALNSAIAAGDDIDGELQGYSGLHLSILYGNRKEALRLIENGANANLCDKNGNTPLHLCALSNALDDEDSAAISTALLKQGADRTQT